MGYRFNPPPNWPPPPPGWWPSPGWRPDPSWPPPPPGWQLWVPDEQDPARPTSPAASELPAAAQPVWRRVRGWYARLPVWAKLLVALLLLGLLPWLLIAAGLALATLGIVGLRRPLPRFKLTSPTAAVGALLLGLVGIGTGSALAVATLTPAPVASPPPAAPTTQSAPPPTVPTTAAPPTTALPATTRAPSTTAAKKPTTTHPPRSSPPASTTKPASLCGAPPNPYGYNFCGRGGYVVDPPADVCAYFTCIDNFWNGRGHMEECRDHTYSMSGGRPGSCSHHGGNRRPVYRGP
jgi:hypothetical protein